METSGDRDSQKQRRDVCQKALLKKKSSDQDPVVEEYPEIPNGDDAIRDKRGVVVPFTRKELVVDKKTPQAKQIEAGSSEGHPIGFSAPKFANCHGMKLITM